MTLEEHVATSTRLFAAAREWLRSEKFKQHKTFVENEARKLQRGCPQAPTTFDDYCWGVAVDILRGNYERELPGEAVQEFVLHYKACLSGDHSTV